jgi:hypothetical protein
MTAIARSRTEPRNTRAARVRHRAVRDFVILNVVGVCALVTLLAALPAAYRDAHGIRGTFVARSSDCQRSGCLTTGDVRLPGGAVVADVQRYDVSPGAGRTTRVSVVRRHGRYAVYGRDALRHWHATLAWTVAVAGLLLVEGGVVLLVVRRRRRAA